VTMPLPSELMHLQARLAAAANDEIRRLARALFPDAPPRTADLRVATLRLYAIRMTTEEWLAFILHGEPAAIVIDLHDAALLAELD
jgi:hypothetical protein